VPESVLTVSKPGDIFVHRNIANQFHLDDDNALSVLTYAVDELGASHVIVVGHTNCGGAAACHAAANASTPLEPPTTPLERWLRPMVLLAKEKGLSAAELVEENVRMQVDNLAQAATTKGAWAKGKDVQIHGWVYDLASGRLRDLGITKGKEV